MDKVTNYDRRNNEKDDIDYGNTARLDGSGRSSTLSIGRQREMASEGNNSQRGPYLNSASYNLKKINNNQDDAKTVTERLGNQQI